MKYTKYKQLYCIMEYIYRYFLNWFAHYEMCDLHFNELTNYVDNFFSSRRCSADKKIFWLYISIN